MGSTAETGDYFGDTASSAEIDLLLGNISKLPNVAFFVWNEDDGKPVYVSGQLPKFYRMSMAGFLETFGDNEKIAANMVGEDGERYLAATRAGIAAASSYEVEFRFYRADGTICFAREVGEYIWNAKTNRVSRSVGALIDITALKETEGALQKSLEYQTATSQILHVISRSPTDIQPVMDVVCRNAARVCAASDAHVFRVDGDNLHLIASYQPQLPSAIVREGGFPLVRSTATGRAVLDRRSIHVADLAAELGEYPDARPYQQGTGHRTLLATPLLRDGVPVGVFVLARNHVEPFTDKQIELVATFADQAVIAIENAQLFEEVQARTAELSEALEQQTAMADVLKVISRSTFDLDKVLTALIASAINLCEAIRGVIWLRKADHLRLAAHVNYPDEWVKVARDMVLTPAADAVTASGLAAYTGEVVNVEDLPNDPRFRSLAAHGLGEYRGGLAVPLKRDGEVVGVISLSRSEARAFTDRQIALVQTFADQAVIAIENARLFEEVQARNREVTEALEQQTATADVLKVISRSIGQTEPVFDAILESAARLCDASSAHMALRDGDGWRNVAAFGGTPEWEEYRRQHPQIMHPMPSSAMGRVLATGMPVHVDDAIDDQAYRDGDPGRLSVVRLLGARTLLCVPLLRDGSVVGIITLHRQEVRPFSEKQIALISSFASQAVIAIENARLFSEIESRNRDVSEALQQQTAMSDVLNVISRSVGQTEPVFEAILESAARLCEASFANLALCEGDGLRHAAMLGSTPEWEAYRREHPILRPLPSSAIGRVLATRMPVHVHDGTDDQAFRDGDLGRLSVVNLLGARTILSVPLLKDGDVVGVITIHRQVVRPFTEKQIALVANFASQAVIAIENARLFSELEARNREVSEALEQQTATADVLKLISRTAFDLKSVLETLARSSSELCGANESIIFLRSGEEYHARATHGADPALLDYLKANPRRKGQKSVVPRVIETGAVVHIPDKLLDEDYAFPGAVQFSDTRAMLGVPMIRDGLVEGVFVVSRYEAGAFSQRRIALLQVFADQAMIAIENARLFTELEARNREILSRYFSPNLADKLTGGVEEIELAGQRREVAALFTDIEGFTTLVELMEPEMLGELLNGYLAGVTSVVFSHEGTVAKVIGDAVHVLFGAPGDQPDSAARAVTCALDIDAFAQSFRETWRDKGVALGVTRIGVNAGPAIVGNFGGGRFFDYTAYGDTINIAARLETANKQLGTRVCVSESTARQVPDFKGRPVGDLLLRGRAEPLRAYEPLRPEQYDDPLTRGYLAAFAKLETNDPGALGAFATEVGKQPDDRLASFHLKRLLNGATGTRINMD